jgi:hypothetical protein
MLLEFKNFFSAAYKASKKGSCGSKSCSRLTKGEYGWSDENSVNTQEKRKVNKLNLRDKSIVCYYDETNQKIILELSILNNQINIAIEQAKNFIQKNENEILLVAGKAGNTQLIYKEDKNIKNKLFVYYSFG